MFGKKFVIERKNVYAGEVVEAIDDNTTTFFNYKKNEELNEQTLNDSDYKFYCGIPLRGMLFTIDADGLAEDLLYSTPKYPITNVLPKVDVEGNIIVNHFINLDLLLKYLKYGELLTRNDLKAINRLLISHEKWLNKNMHLFGLHKLGLDGYCREDNEIIPYDIYDNLRWVNRPEFHTPQKVEQTVQQIKKMR